MRATIRQVAARAGVSRTTVSNVLLGREGRITPEKRQAVLDAVEELKYVPVRTSLQNRQPQTRVLAMAMESPRLVAFDFHSRVYEGICEAALRNDYDVLTVLRSDPDWAASHSAVRLLDGRSDGILLFPTDKGDDATLESLARHGTPSVMLFRRDLPPGIAWVDPDNEKAISTFVKLLASRGHRKIAHLTYFVDNQYDFRARLEAFRASLRAEGLPELPNGAIICGSDVTRADAEAVLATGATAVVCGNDWLAFRLWDHLEALGVRVPEDISLTGIDNQQIGERGGLTTMGFTYQEVGILAVEALLSIINGKPPEESCMVVPLEFFEGQTVKTI